MYDVYHGYSTIELRTKEDYNFLRDGYEFEDFRLCFAFKLRQIEKNNIRSFFKYQLKVNFQSDKEQFKDFVKDIIDGYNEPNFFPAHIIKPVNNFLGEAYLSEITSIEVAAKESEDNIKQKDTAIRTKATKYLLQALNVDSKNDEKIKFIRYLLGKGESKDLKGTNEGKAFYDNETHKTKQGKIRDLEKVIELFAALKLSEPLKLAQLDLNRLKK